MSRILSVLKEVDQLKEIGPIQTIKPVGMATAPKPAPGAQTQQAVAPTTPAANVQVTGTQTGSQPASQASAAANPAMNAKNFSDTLKDIMTNAGLRSEFEKLLAKVK